MKLKILLILLFSLLTIGISPWFGQLSLENVNQFVLWQLRIPRVLNGILVGATLSLAGAAFQFLFGNPLATPSTTGTTAGASLGALIAIVLLPPEYSHQYLILPLFAFLGAVLISFPLALLASRAKIGMEYVLLAGIGASLASSAISTGLQFQADMSATYRSIQWSLGSLSQIGYQNMFWLAPLCLLSMGGLFSVRKGLENLISGEEQAFAQGVPIQRIRSLTILFASLGVAVCVASCGPIAFVGLLVPHLLRLFLGSSRHLIFFLSPIFGAAFLVLCDVLARSLFSSGEVPVGVITSALGAPMLLGLIIFGRRRQS